MEMPASASAAPSSGRGEGALEFDKHHTPRRRFDVREQVAVRLQKPLNDFEVALDDAQIPLQQSVARPQDHQSLELASARAGHAVPKYMASLNRLARLGVAAGNPS